MKSGLLMRVRLSLLACALSSCCIAFAIGSVLGLGFASFLLASMLSLLLVAVLFRAGLGHLPQRLRVLSDGAHALQEGDYSVEIAIDDADELGELASAYNTVTEALRKERQDIHQRELLLSSIIQTAPQALLLVGADQRIVFANAAAESVFGTGQALQNQRLQDALADCEKNLRDALLQQKDGLVVMHSEYGEDTYQLLHQKLSLNEQAHTLYQLGSLTRDLARQEILTWKKVIRIISHEVNNSLAPVSSMAHSARTLLSRNELARAERALLSIGERTEHLSQFIGAYAEFARLPVPSLDWVVWTAMLETVRHTVPFQLLGDVPTSPVWCDRIQMEQTLINLLKNAHESGSPPEAVCLQIEATEAATSIRVLDRGQGMSDLALSQALLPFYSTKATGSGLGLALSRDIIEAHDGRLALLNRQDGGLEVRLQLPAGPRTP